MTMLKSFSGHASCKGIYKYLNYDRKTGLGRALGFDSRMVMNQQEWWREFDETRRVHGKFMQRPPHGKPREYYHFIISPDEADHADLDTVREIANAWIDSNFEDYQCAIVYHNDNEERLSLGKEGIVHAHVIVNSVHPETGNKIQLRDDDVDRLADSLQAISADFGASSFDNKDRKYKRKNRGSREEEVISKHEERILRRGERSFKQDIRDIVNDAIDNCENLTDLRRALAPYGYGVAQRGNDIVFTTPDRKKVTSRALGLKYNDEGLRKRYIAISFVKINTIRYPSFASRYANTSRALATIDPRVRSMQDKIDALSVIYREGITCLEDFKTRAEELKQFGKSERTALYVANKEIETRNEVMCALRTVLAPEGASPNDVMRAEQELKEHGIAPEDAHEAFAGYVKAGERFADAKAIVDGTAQRLQELSEAEYVARTVLRIAQIKENEEREHRGLKQRTTVGARNTGTPPKTYKNARTAPYWRLQIKKEKYQEIAANDRAYRANVKALEHASTMRRPPKREQQIAASVRAERNALHASQQKERRRAGVEER